MTMSSIIAVDVGEKRVGVAVASTVARIAQPLTTLDYQEAMTKLRLLTDEHQVNTIVVGLPRNQQQQDTQQTKFTKQFMANLATQVTVPIVPYDEAFSSQRARTELQDRKKPYTKADVDALAATFILEDYLREMAT